MMNKIKSIFFFATVTILVSCSKVPKLKLEPTCDNVTSGYLIEQLDLLLTAELRDGSSASFWDHRRAHKGLTQLGQKTQSCLSAVTESDAGNALYPVLERSRVAGEFETLQLYINKLIEYVQPQTRLSSFFSTKPVNWWRYDELLARYQLTIREGYQQPDLSQNTGSSYYLFESGHVRPLALSPDRQRLFAVNTPDNRLEIFDITPEGLKPASSVMVGLEPVAVGVRSNSEVWVVNHLSDSVSIVDVSSATPVVVNTLLVGDEPRDIVFAGEGKTKRAFISTARRGQHRSHVSIENVSGAGDPELTKPGLGRADVWVFDASNLQTEVAGGGVPLRILSFFADTPRALTVSADKKTVYIAAFKSGNQTTILEEKSVCDGFMAVGGQNCPPGAPGGVPGPKENFPASGKGAPAPETGLIVKYDGNAWRDTLGRDWSSEVHWHLPDKDVFAIDAISLDESSAQAFSGVGTVLFNMLENPRTGKLYVSNIESPNQNLFEGAGKNGTPTVQGHISETRITVIDPSSSAVMAQHVNSHIDYSLLHTDENAETDSRLKEIKRHTLALPLQMALSQDSSTLYMAAFGSAKIGVFDVSTIEDPDFADSFDPTKASEKYIDTEGGPSGLILDETRHRLYVMQRFSHSIAEIDLSSGKTLQTHQLFDDEPEYIKLGRQFLYDAQLSSGNGESSCASCHIFGDMDGLAWNLGDPGGSVNIDTQPLNFSHGINVETRSTFHPLKGPMTTQTLKGMANHGAMHWRGDRVSGYYGEDPCNEPSGAPCSEEHSFKNFIVAFEGLLGRDGVISDQDMQSFTRFALSMMLPPNPIAKLDNTVSKADQNVLAQYFYHQMDLQTCNNCHRLDLANGFAGTSGMSGTTNTQIDQQIKIPHFRNLYQKVGMFGRSTTAEELGDQVRGFGFSSDGSRGTIEQILDNQGFFMDKGLKKDFENFLLAYPSDLAPVVGQQVTISKENKNAVLSRLELLKARSQAIYPSLALGGDVPECDLVVRGYDGKTQLGWLYQGGNRYLDNSGKRVEEKELMELVNSGNPLTFTCAVPGTGVRLAKNRSLQNDQPPLASAITTESLNGVIGTD